MMASVENVLDESDVDRVVRFINSAPLKVSLQSGEAVSHDVERFCAFRQDAFHESEKCGEASLMHLRKAQDSRLKLLDGIDKAITIIHLLTNTNWGTGQPIRFLSCRQSIPQRDRVSVAGDSAMAAAIFSEITRARKSITNILLRHQRTKRFMESLRDRKCITEMRRTGSGISPCVSLLPSVSGSSVCSIASVSFINDAPTLETDPFVQFFIRKKLELNFSIGRLPSEQDINPMDVSESDPQDIVARAQICALDLAVIRALQNEDSNGCCEDHRLICIRKSSTEHDHSVSFCFMGNGLPQPLVINLWMGSAVTDENRSVVQSLRKRLLQLRARSPTEESSGTLCRMVCDHIHSLL